MAKAKKVKDVVAAADEAIASVEKAAAKTRGPRGVAESAVITLLVATNPKREGSKASTVFSHYVTGMTIGEFADALDAEGLGKESTPNLVYDAKHGFISIDGYDPGEVVKPKVREPKAAKEPKAPRAKKVKAEKLPKTDEQVQADLEAQEESMA